MKTHINNLGIYTLVSVCQSCIIKVRPTISYKPQGFIFSAQEGGSCPSSTKDTLVVSEIVGRKVAATPFLCFTGVIARTMTMSNEQSSIKEVWEKVKYFLGIAVFGFIVGVFFEWLLAMLLNWTLGVDIGKFDTSYRLTFFLWGIGSLLVHLFIKYNYDKNR